MDLSVKLFLLLGAVSVVVNCQVSIVANNNCRDPIITASPEYLCLGDLVQLTCSARRSARWTSDDILGSGETISFNWFSRTKSPKTKGNGTGVLIKKIPCIVTSLSFNLTADGVETKCTDAQHRVSTEISHVQPSPNGDYPVMESGGSITWGPPSNINKFSLQNYQLTIECDGRVVDGINTTETSYSYDEGKLIPGPCNVTVRVINSCGDTASNSTLFTFEGPTVVPTVVSTVVPTEDSTIVPTVVSTVVPTEDSTIVPTVVSTGVSMIVPTVVSTVVPTEDSTIVPTGVSTVVPTEDSTIVPTVVSTVVSTVVPTEDSTVVPTVVSTVVPTEDSTVVPTVVSTVVSTVVFTVIPTGISTRVSTVVATVVSTEVPTGVPTVVPTVFPTGVPTVVPTGVPTVVPTGVPIGFTTEHEDRSQTGLYIGLGAGGGGLLLVIIVVAIVGYCGCIYKLNRREVKRYKLLDFSDGDGKSDITL